MRRLRRHRLSPWVAKLLGLLIGISGLWGLTPRPAQAQRRVTSIYVLDFNNRTRVGGALLGRVAAAQMSLQLAESLNWDVLPDAQVQRRIQELKLQPPFDRIDRAQIAQGVDASAVVYGTILEARVSARPAQAYVRLQVVVEDINTSVLINGAIAEGVSTPRMGFTGDADVLLEEASGKAAFRAREFMDRFRLPQGTVMNTNVTNVTSTKISTIALLNIGARQGVKPGMRFIVTRLGDFVGRIKVIKVDANVSTARVVQNFQGVRPEDRARAIFSFEDFPITRSLRISSRFGNGSGKYVSTREALPKGIKLAQAKGSYQAMVALEDAPGLLAMAPNEPPPPVVVEEPGTGRRAGRRHKSILNSGALKMLAGGLLLVGILAIGGNSAGDTQPNSARAQGFQRQVGIPGARILVKWDRPKRVPTNDVLGHVVWRMDQFGNFLAVWGTDGDGVRRFEDPDIMHDATFWDGDPNSDDAGSRTVTTDIPGVTAGLQYRYQVATAFTRRGDLDMDGTPDDLDVMSPLSSPSNWATAIQPATIILPAQDAEVDLTNLTVSWQQTPGADKYILMMSTSGLFPKKGTTTIATFQEVPVDLGGSPIITHTVTVRDGALLGAARVFLTIGALNSGDKRKPAPLGAIFSPSLPLVPLRVPPPPPGKTGPLGVAGKTFPGRGRVRGRRNTTGSGVSSGSGVVLGNGRGTRKSRRGRKRSRRRLAK